MQETNVCKIMIRPAMIHGSECWPVSEGEEREGEPLHTAEMRLPRWTLGKMRLSNKMVQAMMQVALITQKLREY